MEQKGLDFGEPERKREARPAAAPQPQRPRPEPQPTRRAYSVAELTERIQGLVETEFVDVWVEGEVSNVSFPASGHWYFSLKDERAQIRAVVWKMATRLIRFRPKDGMKVLVRGSVAVYAPKGEYQLKVELIEPKGKGALQQAYEELKERLTKEGLFAQERKRPLPMLPRRIGIITSPTGAAIQDILRVLSSRYANLEVMIYPARVQGAEGTAEIVKGIEALNRLRGLDVLILARGGGSLEDLWCFNEEAVVRALAGSRIPTISAVGHETDFTIADFVADLRAPTPSAAAERVIQAKQDLAARVDSLERRLHSCVRLRVTRTRARVDAVTSSRVFEAERGRIRAQALRVRELLRRGGDGARRRLERARDAARRATERVEAFRWERQVAQRRERAQRSTSRLAELLRGAVDARRQALAAAAGKLESLSPLAVLSRGYALVRDAHGHVVRVPADVQIGDPVRIRLAAGGLGARVTDKEPA
jgi:exodeoxyribonuclease VII large subunit